MKAVLLATAAAIAVQPIVFLLLFILPLLFQGAHISWSELLSLPLLAALYSLPFIAIVGIPAFLLLRHLNCLSRVSLCLVGGIAAAAPIAIYRWSDFPGYSSGGNWYGDQVDFVVNGQKTFYGWLSYVQSIIFFAMHGLAGALAFFLVWHRVMAPNNPVER